MSIPRASCGRSPAEPRANQTSGAVWRTSHRTGHSRPLQPAASARRNKRWRISIYHSGRGASADCVRKPHLLHIEPAEFVGEAETCAHACCCRARGQRCIGAKGTGRGDPAPCGTRWRTMRLGAKLLCAVALPANRIKAIKAGVLGTPSARERWPPSPELPAPTHRTHHRSPLRYSSSTHAPIACR